MVFTVRVLTRPAEREMTDEERRRLIARFKSHEVVMWTDIDLAAEEIERLLALAQSDAEPVAQKKLEEATTYAEQLAISLAARWYPEVPQWRPLRDDLIGLLTQIDNMSTGAVRVQSDARPLVKYPLGPDDKPMMDWYYDDEGVCRP